VTVCARARVWDNYYITFHYINLTGATELSPAIVKSTYRAAT